MVLQVELILQLIKPNQVMMIQPNQVQMIRPMTKLARILIRQMTRPVTKVVKILMVNIKELQTYQMTRLRLRMQTT